ncbi:MAG: ATP-binding cassette domain-containing protein [Verrucomicrobiota bacterium]|nr:ATP-binding cassette domain-containing protein [Verrucomicrobiota bacterium]
MIEFRNVTKMLGGRAVLDGVSFHVEQGETFVIVGSSGVGKSVTLKHMVRLFRPDEGEVLVDGESISRATGSRLEKMREQFGYLFQGGALLAWLTVAENVALPLREKTALSNDEILKRVRETLKLVGLENDGHKHPSEISGGMQKRAGLARAIVRQARIVLYDEPTSGLDPVTSRAIDALIEGMRRELGVTSVVVTHDLHSALSIGARIAMLHGGKMIECAAPEDFVRSSRPEVRAFLESQFITKRGAWERIIQ